jgi:sodium-dependent dicarboxylate transporter 2/3/5
VGGLEGDPKRLLAAVVWMAVWWVTEAVPLAATSLIPLVLFPVLDLRSVRDVAPNYSNHMVFLFLGGFILALAVERSGLHRRVALAILNAIGCSLRRLVWGFLVATALLSMWLSNTATATLLMPVMAALAAVLGVHPYLVMVPAIVSASCAFMLPVATPPNVIVIGSGRVGIHQLFREGFWLNIIGAVLTTIVVLTVGRLVLPL